MRRPSEVGCDALEAARATILPLCAKWSGAVLLPSFEKDMERPCSVLPGFRMRQWRSFLFLVHVVFQGRFPCIGPLDDASLLSSPWGGGTHPEASSGVETRDEIGPCRRVQPLLTPTLGLRLCHVYLASTSQLPSELVSYWPIDHQIFEDYNRKYPKTRTSLQRLTVCPSANSIIPTQALHAM